MVKHKKSVAVSLVLAGCAIILICVMCGSANIGIRDVGAICFYKITGIGNVGHLSPAQIEIIWTLRVPRVLLAFIVGAGLSVGGVLIQSVMKNPLASPFTMGVSAGASLAVSVMVVTGYTLPFLGVFFQPLVGFVAGIVSVLVVMAITLKIDKNTATSTLVLFGMVFSLFCNAWQTILMAFYHEDLKKIVLWQMGSFSMRGWNMIWATGPFILLGIGFSMYIAKELDILSMGNDQARTMGVHVTRYICIALILSAVMTGATVAVCGIVGFIDLIIPHITRQVFGSRHVVVIPLAAIIGGMCLVVADTLARTLISPAEIPVGAITAILGGPFFAYVFLGRRRA